MRNAGLGDVVVWFALFAIACWLVVLFVQNLVALRLARHRVTEGKMIRIRARIVLSKRLGAMAGLVGLLSVLSGLSWEIENIIPPVHTADALARWLIDWVIWELPGARWALEIMVFGVGQYYVHDYVWRRRRARWQEEDGSNQAKERDL